MSVPLHGTHVHSHFLKITTKLIGMIGEEKNVKVLHKIPNNIGLAEEPTEYF